MKVVRLSLLAWCFGWIAGGCTSDLKLSLDNLRCNESDRCSRGYVCDKPSGYCVRPELGQPPVFPSTDAGDAGQALGGMGSGGVGGSGGNAGGAGGSNAGGQGAGAGGSLVDLDGGLYGPDGGDACVPQVIYRDNDNDGFGDVEESRMGCPGNGWVVDGTDCRDDISDVHPAQAEFFGIPYFGSMAPSFDYDCSGGEEPSPANDTNAEVPNCPALSLVGCQGSGFLPASEPPRDGAGVDPRCGSNLRRNCQANGLACESDDTEVGDSLIFLCH